MKEPRIISAGYCCVDITPHFHHGSAGSLQEMMKPGKLTEVGKAHISTGGSVSNTGLALHRFGADVKLAAKIGDDAFGKILIDKYRELGADARFIVAPGDETSYTIAIAPPGCDRIFFADPGANGTFRSSDISDDLLRDADYFHFGYPTLMRQLYLNDGAQTTDLFRRAKNFGLITSLDLAMCDPESEAASQDLELILKNVLPYVDFFTPSVEELCFILDREHFGYLQKKAGNEDVCMHLSLREDVIPLAEKALSFGCGAVMIKCGAPGIYFRSSGAERMSAIGPQFSEDGWTDLDFFQNSFVPEQIVSGTGAGDNAIAAFLYGISHGCSAEMSVALAACAGACNITQKDALSGLIPIEEMKKRISEGWPTQHFMHS